LREQAKGSGNDKVLQRGKIKLRAIAKDGEKLIDYHPRKFGGLRPRKEKGIGNAKPEGMYRRKKKRKE